MPEILDLRQMVAALLGGIIALAGRAATVRAVHAKTAQRLCMAFYEELNATRFYGSQDSPNFAGFSAQTFDSLFQEMSQCLPRALVRDLMKYHWRMKYMEEMKPVTLPSSGGVNRQYCAEAKKLHGSLLTRLQHYGSRNWCSIFIIGQEICRT